jgi:phosphoribosylformimino-5-aminoimidazole carboxamide ribotide isomerase
MLIIPAIDMINGECVRLSKGDYKTRKVYEKDPLEMAKRFEGAGLTNLHLVDLDGAKAGAVQNWSAIEKIAKHTGLKVDFGGGVKTDEQLARLFELGIDKVTCGSIAVKNREKVLSWLERYPGRLILGADCLNGNIETAGWLEKSNLKVEEFVSGYFANGFRYCISTDISRDGMLSGPAFDLYEKLSAISGELCLIASGGISCPEDLKRLASMGLYGAIVGKAYYEGRLTLEEMGGLNNAC